MIDIRPFASLGGANHGWLDARHHFSFANYHDPARMGWGALRVWNDDTIAPRSGFPPHPHRDMEIITYVRDGAISHEDSLGNRGRTVAGDVQVMSAGTGVTHAEYNREDQVTRIFQLWILPDRPGGPPAWGARAFPRGERAGRFEILASGRPGDGAAAPDGPTDSAGDAAAGHSTAPLPIRADACVAGATLRAGQTLRWPLAPGRRAYLVPATGTVRIGPHTLHARDGAAIADEAEVIIEGIADAELVLVDVAG